MSDDEEFIYSDDDGGGDADINEDDPAVVIDNAYYNAKSIASSGDIASARAAFISVLALADDGNFPDYRFRALKRLVKLAARTGDMRDMLARYNTLLQCVASGVTKNRAEKAITGILDLVGGTSAAAAAASTVGVAAAAAEDSATAAAALREFYDRTLVALEGSANDRLAHKTRIKLARLYLEQRDLERLRDLLDGLEVSSGLAAIITGSTFASSAGISVTGVDDLRSAGPAAAARPTQGAAAVAGFADNDKSKATQALEVAAIKIQYAAECGDLNLMAAAHRAAATLARSAVPHPAVSGIIHECGGKLAMRNRLWDEARIEFFAAFKAFEEAGAGSKAVVCLKYQVLSNMLADSKLNPFDSQDTKAYEKDPAVAAMAELSTAYLANDIALFEPVLRRSSMELQADSFMAPYIIDLLTSIRSTVMLSFIAPYARVSITRLSAELGATASETEAIVVAAILDGKLLATIDQVEGTITVIKAGNSSAVEKSTAVVRAVDTGVPTRRSGAAQDASNQQQSRRSPATRTRGAPAHNRYDEIERLANGLQASFRHLVRADGVPIRGNATPGTSQPAVI